MTKLKRIYLTGFFVLQAFLFLPIVFSIGESTSIAYCSILLCLATSILLLKQNKHSILQFVALFTTACADYFLILKGGVNKDVAMCFFVVTQLAYGLRTLYMSTGKKEVAINLMTRVVLCIALVVGSLLIVEDVPAFVLLSMIYFANLVTNVVFALLHFNQNKLLALGLLLFICCDVFVGIKEMINLFGWGEEKFVVKMLTTNVSVHSIFYHPSQVLLSISTTDKNTK